MLYFISLANAMYDQTHRKSRHGYRFIEIEALLFRSASAVMETNETFTSIQINGAHICAYIVHNDKWEYISILPWKISKQQIKFSNVIGNDTFS